jgi:hypothetical protein
MSSLSFQKQFKILNITPLKFSICSIITNLLRDTNPDKTNNKYYALVDLVSTLINDFECEISKEILFNKIHKILNNLFTKYSIPQNESENMSQKVTQAIEKDLHNVTNLQELYIFFNFRIRELKTKDENNKSLIETGGIIDHFIRKCLFAFYKLNFEELVGLYNNILKYRNNEKLNIELTDKESELLFEKQIEDINLTINNDGKAEINGYLLNSKNYKHKYFFSKENELGKYLFK